MGAIVSVTLVGPKRAEQEISYDSHVAWLKVKQGCWSLLSFAELFQYTVRCACKSVDRKKEKERKAKL